MSVQSAPMVVVDATLVNMQHADQDDTSRVDGNADLLRLVTCMQFRTLACQSNMESYTNPLKANALALLLLGEVQVVQGPQPTHPPLRDYPIPTCRA
jgi:hypothetical protein